MTYLITVDPGLSTGVCLAHYSNTEPWRRVAVWQFGNGIQGWVDFFESQEYEVAQQDDYFHYQPQPESMNQYFCAEVFTPRPTDKFNLTWDSIEPVRIEGALVAQGLMSADRQDQMWQQPSEQYFMAAQGDTLAQKKKKAQLFLKEHGLWNTGKDVEQPDGHDANSATLHSLARMRNMKHIPTLRKFS